MACKPTRSIEYEEQTITPTQKALLKSLEDVENELKKIRHVKNLGERLQELRRNVKDVFENQEKKMKIFENQEKEMKILHEKIQKLQDDVKKEKEKNSELEKALSLAQATWAWEKHLARFVVDPSIVISPSGWKDQMTDYLNEINTEPNRLDRIRNIDKKEQKKRVENNKKTWRCAQWRVIKNIRRERNCLAHPCLFNLNLVEAEIANMSDKQQEFLKDMMDELKMTASLMKFGRLANQTSENVHGKQLNKHAMTDIISWDRNFEEIYGILNIEHEEAKGYLEKYVNNPGMIHHYILIVDSIKETNSERLGRMARRIKLPEDSQEYDKALSILKQLPLTDRKRKSLKGCPNLNATIARLHVPDFLPKDLWEDGIKLVEKYFH